MGIEGYDLEGRRNATGGGSLGFLQSMELQKRRELAARDLAEESRDPNDETLLSPVKIYHQHVRKLLDEYIVETSTLSFESKGLPKNHNEYQTAIRAAVVARLQEFRVHIFGTPSTEKYYERDDLFLKTHEAILSEESE